VTTVAQRLIGSGFASAKECFAILFCGVFHRLEIAAFVRAIAKWLFRALTAGTPKVGFARFNFYSEWFVSSTSGFGHLNLQ
jgi:hypothetical protein